MTVFLKYLVVGVWLVFVLRVASFVKVVATNNVLTRAFVITLLSVITVRARLAIEECANFGVLPLNYIHS